MYEYRWYDKIVAQDACFAPYTLEPASLCKANGVLFGSVDAILHRLVE